MKYLFTPYDLAVFFYVSDFPQSYERTVMHNIWEDDKDSIPAKYRKDAALFRRHVFFELSKFDGSLDDLDELNLLLRDTERSVLIDGAINEQDVIESYFKIIKLRLSFDPGRSYYKIKLRTLLGSFGYKRRSPQLVSGIRRTLMALELITYLRDYLVCDIAKIGIDDMVMIRLK